MLALHGTRQLSQTESHKEKNLSSGQYSYIILYRVKVRLQSTIHVYMHVISQKLLKGHQCHAVVYTCRYVVTT